MVHITQKSYQWLSSPSRSQYIHICIYFVIILNFKERQGIVVGSESVTAADTLLDSLEVAENELTRLKTYNEKPSSEKFESNPLMMGLSPSAYVLRAVNRVKAADLEAAIVCLPFANALILCTYLAEWLSKRQSIETCTRCASLLVRLHFDTLCSSQKVCILWIKKASITFFSFLALSSARCI